MHGRVGDEGGFSVWEDLMHAFVSFQLVYGCVRNPEERRGAAGEVFTINTAYCLGRL